MIHNNHINFPFSVVSDMSFGLSQTNRVEIASLLLSYENSKIKGDIDYNIYNITLKKNYFTQNKNLIIICTKDHSDLTNYTLKKLFTHEVNKIADILLVDDRSQNNSIVSLAEKYQISCLRIDNTSNIFNYSNLNNIAAAYANFYDKSNLVFWNNDLWPSDKETFPTILQKHIDHKASLSGVRMLYPSKKEYIDSCYDLEHILGKHLENFILTIQHGGIAYVPTNAIISSKTILKPYHNWRFENADHIIACSDQIATGVTGAFHLIDTRTFIEHGGYNPSMSHTIQDIDFCLKLLKSNKKIMYFGSNKMFHAESITSFNDKITNNKYCISDNILYELIWKEDINKLVGYGFLNYIGS